MKDKRIRTKEEKVMNIVDGGQTGRQTGRQTDRQTDGHHTKVLYYVDYFVRGREGPKGVY